MDLHFGGNLPGAISATAAGARQLEDLGFEYAATGEHFMRGNPPLPTGTALPVLGVAAGATTTIRLLSCIALADRKSTRLNSSHIQKSRMPSSA